MIHQLNTRITVFIKIVIQNLWMPHNIKFIDGSLHILDSLPGQLKTNNSI